MGVAEGELLPDLRLQVDDRVEMRVGRPGSSSELEAELIAQSVSLSGEKLVVISPLTGRSATST